ncbi:GerAB/ArcD/ProY family transporter [Paenibacillus sp. LjRoot56]|uniref:GerAB/ArcD/ProY family transporter n=1 Tax=Paenibacillus sp. LjRoot56 TaxID=3342333 RepID=UPI003ED134AD
MIERGKISSLQMALIQYSVVLATGDLLIPAVTAKLAKRDLWLSPIWASVMGFVVVYFVYRLYKLFPKETIVQHAERVLGPITGKIVGIYFLFTILQIDGNIVRSAGEFLSTAFLPKTPILVIMGSVVMVCSFAVRGGLEVIARCAQIFIPIVMILWILFFLLLTPSMKPGNMLPIFANGIMPSFIGAIPPAAVILHSVLITFMLPYLRDPEKGMKWGMISVVISALTLTFITMATLFIFGDITSQLVYPVMMAIRYIEMAGFIEHLESFMMAVWMIGTFIKITIYYYAFVLGLSQWLRLSDYRPLVFPAGFMLVTFSIWVAPDVQEFTHFLGTVSYFWSASIEAGVPIILLLAAMVQKMLQRNNGGQKG